MKIIKLFIPLFTLFSSVFFVIFQVFPYNEPIKRPEEAIHLLDRFMQDVPSLPRYVEGGYSPLGRSPVVDTLLHDPLYMPTYAEIVTGSIKTHSTNQAFFPLAPLF